MTERAQFRGGSGVTEQSDASAPVPSAVRREYASTSAGGGPLARLGESRFTVIAQRRIADSVYELRLAGDCRAITTPGQFVNVAIPGFFLRRPISVADVIRAQAGNATVKADSGTLQLTAASTKSSARGATTADELVLIYKVVGAGTHALAALRAGAELDILTGLGNGYHIAAASRSAKPALLIGGGVGVPPLYWLAKRLRAAGKPVTAILGFNTARDVFYEQEFARLGCSVTVTTADGSRGVPGVVTAALPAPEQVSSAYAALFTCGPLPMLRAVAAASGDLPGQFSFEERMGCGFGACMGCSHRVRHADGTLGYKRICADGPVLAKEEIVW